MDDTLTKALFGPKAQLRYAKREGVWGKTKGRGHGDRDRQRARKREKVRQRKRERN